MAEDGQIIVDQKVKLFLNGAYPVTSGSDTAHTQINTQGSGNSPKMIRRRSSSIRVILLTVLMLALPQLASAFGQNGHRVVGQIAENHLSPAALEQVDVLLQGRSLAMVSTWADEMRSSPDPFWSDRISDSWHYINTERGKGYRESKKNPKGDSYEASHRFMTTLGDITETKEKRADALRWLVHLVGDIHQPMHNAYADDRGGNRVKVRWFGEATNLHSVWDTHLVESKNLSYTEWVRYLDTDDQQLISEYQDTVVMDWIDESLVLRDRIYAVKGSEFRYRYIHDFMPAVEQRLLQAGIRLAGVLNRILDPSK